MSLSGVYDDVDGGLEGRVVDKLTHPNRFLANVFTMAPNLHTLEYTPHSDNVCHGRRHFGPQEFPDVTLRHVPNLKHVVLEDVDERARAAKIRDES